MENKTTKPFYNTTIPRDWEVRTVAEAFKICNNLRLPISEEERKKIQGEFPYYGPTKIQDFINEFRIEGKYALIGEDGDHFLKWKELPMTLLVEGKFNVNNHAHIIQGGKNLTEWFFYYFNQKELTTYLTRQGAGRYKLTKESLSKIPIPLPPLPEQRAIAHVLSLMDSAINKNNQLIAQKELRKKWLMQNLLTGKKRLKGFDGEWKDVELGELLNYEQPTKYLVKDTLYNNNYSIPVLTAGKTFILGYSKEETGVCSDLPIVIFDDFTTASKYVDFPFKAKSSAMKLLRPKSNANLKFVFEGMQLMNYAVGGHERHWISKFVYLTIPCPPIEEQTAIARVLQAADKEIQILKTKTEKLRQQKKGMMQVLLTGKKRLKFENE